MSLLSFLPDAFSRLLEFLVALVVALAPAPALSDPPASELTERLNIPYGNPEGQEVLLDAFLPHEPSSTATLERRPVVLLVHGGGWVGGARSEFHQAARWFAQHGYVSFSAGYRLVHAGKNHWPAQLEDVQLAVRWIREHASEFQIDPDKIGAIGGSAGGHLVAMLALVDTQSTASIPLAQHSSKVNRAVNWMGPADLTGSFPVSLPPHGLNLQKLVDDLLGVSGPERDAVARSASPIYQVSSAASPLLIWHGAKDALVPVEQPIRFAEALRNVGASVKLVILEEEGHGLKPENMQRMLRESHAFYQEQFAGQ